jgi:YesN/AraC family two-component response regulator
VHLKFLLDHAPSVSLEPLWQLALHQSPTAEAQVYWQRLEANLLALTGQASAVLERYNQHDLQVALQIGREAIQYWQAVIEGYQRLTLEEATARLRKAEKVDQKIQAIEKTLQHIEMSL